MAFTPSGRIFQALFSCLWLIVNIKCQVTVPLLPSELGPNQGIPACPPLNPFAYMRDATNCGMFYRCFWGKAVPMSGCTPGLVFSNRLNICVHSGSLWDDCPVGKPAAGAPKYLTPEQRCSLGESVFPHPDGCALFYNCSLRFQHRPRRHFASPLEDECPYPQLFSNETLKCENFLNVTCGTRKEPKAPCDYKKRRCPVAHCRPCWAVTPSCVNASDGLHFDSLRMWTPAFVECKQERTISVRRCEPLNDIPQIFSPELLQCVSIYDVPRRFNGLRPNCAGKQDQLYPEENGRCNIYIQCTNQTYAGYGQCPQNLNFDFATQSCMSPSEMCPPCGTNQTACTI